ncbi:MAG: hypothetical protein H0X26_01905 [Alphaproteobacteria bacterium]|nr:hypothetical protein [Alphaproteobacteria bacterium]
MPDQIINHSHASLKHLNQRFDKLSHTIEELEKLAYRYHRLSYEINQIDVMAFHVRQEFEQLREAYRRVRESE